MKVEVKGQTAFSAPNDPQGTERKKKHWCASILQPLEQLTGLLICCKPVCCLDSCESPLPSVELKKRQCNNPREVYFSHTVNLQPIFRPHIVP